MHSMKSVAQFRSQKRIKKGFSILTHFRLRGSLSLSRLKIAIYSEVQLVKLKPLFICICVSLYPTQAKMTSLKVNTCWYLKYRLKQTLIPMPYNIYNTELKWQSLSECVARNNKPWYESLQPKALWKKWENGKPHNLISIVGNSIII